MRHAPLAAAAALLLAAGLAACGQPFLSARIEVPRIRIVQPPTEFPALPVDPNLVCAIVQTPGCTAQTFSFDIGSELDQKGVTTDLRLTALSLHFTRGDARGVRLAEVALLDPQAGTTTLVARYARPVPVPAGRMTDVVMTTSGADLSPFLRSGTLDARVEVALDPVYLPTGFAASVDATFSAKVTVDYREL
jgi:hypothetical protein